MICQTAFTALLDFLSEIPKAGIHFAPFLVQTSFQLLIFKIERVADGIVEFTFGFFRSVWVVQLFHDDSLIIGHFIKTQSGPVPALDRNNIK